MVDAAVEETEAPVEEAVAVEETEAPVEEAAAVEETEAPAAETADFENDGSYVASVDGQGIKVDDFVETAAFNRYQYLNMYYQYAQMYSMYGLPLDSLDQQVTGILGEEGKETFGTEIVDQMTFYEALHHDAEEAGIELTEDEIYAQLKTMFGYTDPEPESEGPMGLDSFNIDPSATDSEEDKNAAFRTYAVDVLNENYGGVVSFDYIKNYAENILLTNKMFAKELENRTFEAEMVNARHILVADEETAKDIIAKLNAGEDWAALASENSLDTANKDNSGALGWFSRGQMVAEFEEAAFALEPGEITAEPVQTSYGFHIIASDGKEIRPLNGSALEAAQNAAYDEWVASVRAAHDIQSYPEVWLDAVPMEPAFVSLAAPQTAATEEAPAEETAADAAVEETAVEEAVTEEAPAEETAADAAVEETAVDAVVTEEAPAEVTAADAAVEETAVDAVVTEEAPAEETAADAAVEETAVDAVVTEEAPAEETAAEAETVVVAKVNDIEITGDEFVQEATFNRYQIISTYNQYAQYYAMFGLPLDEMNAYYVNLLGEDGKQEFGETIINQLTYYKMLELESAEMGITATKQDGIDMMNQAFGYTDQEAEAENTLGLESFDLEEELDNDDSEDVARAMIEMDISMMFNDKLSYDFFVEYFRHGVLENKVMDKLMEDRVLEEEMVNARHILVEDEETAKNLLKKLNAGEEWNDLAAEFSQDESNKDDGGALGWFGRGRMVEELENAAFALEPGEISEPVKSAFGWHIIASDGKEMRPMDETALEAAKGEIFQEWYDSLLEKYNVESYPEIWLPLVPTEPVFEPIDFEALAENEDIPTFHIISEDESADETEEDLTIRNTEQEVTVEPTEEPAETETGSDETGENAEEDLTIRNTEQEVTEFLLDNDAENH